MSPKISFIAEIGLRVTDLLVMSQFYQKVLGFEIHLETPTHIFLKIGDLPSPLGSIGHPQVLGLFARNFEPEATLSTLDHLAFEIPAEEYDREKAHFEAQGLVLRERKWPETLDWRGRSFFFKDPEGNVIELIAAMENTEN